jgi:transposase
MNLSESDKALQKRIEIMLPLLNERQSRIYLGIEADCLGRGGISKVHKLSGANRRTIAAGVKEISSGVKETGEKKASQLGKSRIRKKGGGRKKEVEKHPQILLKLMEIILPHTMGDPEKPLIWCSKSIRKIKKTLREEGYQISHESIRKYLKSLNFSLQSNKKTKEGGNHPDRDAQFVHINSVAQDFLSAGDPVISVDCKKKELIGEYKNNGQEWSLAYHPEEVGVYDFVDKTNGKAAPYGVYDIGNNRGWVSVGISSDTAAFAVSTIQSWWEGEGKDLYPSSKRLYVNADGGGSNGSRNKLWKEELQKFANQHDLEVHVSHFPPGTSKWNKIEHRLFSQISLNWRAKPLTSLLVILNLIGATTTETGLVVKAILDKKQYQTGIKITDEQVKERNIEKNEFHGEWNYIMRFWQQEVK